MMMYGQNFSGFVFGKKIILYGTHFVSSSLAKELQTYSQSLLTYIVIYVCVCFFNIQ
jgi:hypothetical protein